MKLEIKQNVYVYTSQVKHTHSSSLPQAFTPVFRCVKAIKIYQDFPEL